MAKQELVLEYVVSGSISGPLLIFVLYTFCRFKRIRSHPAGLMFARTLADTGMIFSTLILSTFDEETCQRGGPIISFFFMASQFYFIGMCYDLYITCTYPLRSVDYTARNVHLSSWLLSAIITLIFTIWNRDDFGTYSITSDKSNLCFLGIEIGSNDGKLPTPDVQELVTFILPYTLGICSGICSLIFVFIRLRNGLGDVFEHASIMVKDHIIFCLLYTILGIVWFILLLQAHNEIGLSFAISFIIIGTSAIDCVTWILQKFKAKSNVNDNIHRTTYLGNFLRKQTELMTVETDNDDLLNLAQLQIASQRPEQTMSSALRLELIRNMCSGVTQSLDHFKHNREYINHQDIQVTALHFPSYKTINMKKKSNLERTSLENQSIHRFLMASHSSGGSDQIDFIDYAPHVFRYLRRECFNTSETEYAESVKIAIDNNSSMDELSAKFSEGKSGAFFFMTPNSEFMVKTLRQSEAITFLKILPGYFEHMRKFPNSFITKFYGLYGIKLYGTRLYFTIMKNIFVADLEPHEKYDIKGSWVNRHTKHHIELGKLMKDEDLKKHILLSSNESKKAWEQMSHDTRFLNTLNIMDYSLLLGIYYIGISTQNINFKQSNANWSFNANATNGGSYKPPQKQKQKQIQAYHEDNIELQIQHQHHQEEAEENEELKQPELKEGDDDLTEHNKENQNNDKEKHEKSGKSDLLDLNTLSKMQKDFSKLEDKLSPKHKNKNGKSETRRRAFTAGTGLAELSTHPMSYQSKTIEGPGFYIMGIIDILQEYNWEKKIERFLKVFVLCVDSYGISCIEPGMYRKRFLAKMLQIGIGRDNK